MSPLTRTLQTAALAFGHEELPLGNAETLQRGPALMDGAARVDWLDPEADDGTPSPISAAHNARFVANEVSARDSGRAQWERYVCRVSCAWWTSAWFNIESFEPQTAAQVLQPPMLDGAQLNIAGG